jgi:hypothetical protein
METDEEDILLISEDEEDTVLVDRAIISTHFDMGSATDGAIIENTSDGMNVEMVDYMLEKL